MKNIKFALVCVVLIIGYVFKDSVVGFLSHNVIWGIKVWMLGIWGIYKCSYYIWQGDDKDPHTMEDTGREYRNLNEARYKELKHQTQSENVGRKIDVENWTDENGQWYFIIRVFHELGEFIFIPFKK